MSIAASLQLSYDLGLCKNHNYRKQFKSTLGRGRLLFSSTLLSSRALLQQHDSWSARASYDLQKHTKSVSYRSSGFKCHSFLSTDQAFRVPGLKAASVALTRSYSALQGIPLTLKLASAVGLMVFALWGLGPLMRLSRNLVLHKNDNNWKKSGTYHVTTSCIQPLLLWVGAILICRVIDPVILPTETSQFIKQRLLNFVRSLSTVLAFAYCLSGVIQEAQKYFESNETNDARKMGFQFAGKAVYSAVWVAAVSLFMELLGFSTQKWLTAGGLGTVLLTLAGREIFTNFLSSAMIHATRPFVVNEWIQTKIEGYEVSGTVEHVGWWSPTIIRGEDREAVHIPNHKFTVNVVRNLTQKTHWRIKTHLAISHLDVSKINNIVADMRKVLAKNPQVEQQRLHRRVFLENVNPENQALMILVSCFVKTSHFEEYLCVKEAVLMDLLRVIRHHRARLATPIRTVQKLYSDPDLENVPFADSFYNHDGVASHRPLLLIEPSYKINGEDKTKPQTRTSRPAGEQDAKTAPRSTVDNKGGATAKVDSKAKETPKSETKGADSSYGDIPDSEGVESRKASIISASDSQVADNVIGKPSLNSKSKSSSSSTNGETSHPVSKGAETVSKNSTGKAPDSKQPKSMISGSAKQNSSKVESPLISKSATEIEKGSGLQESPQSKQEVERKSAPPPSVSKPALEENLVLGVALEGSKRTLPIEEDMNSPTESEVKEMAATCRDGTGTPSTKKNKVDSPAPPSPTTSDR